MEIPSTENQQPADAGHDEKRRGAGVAMAAGAVVFLLVVVLVLPGFMAAGFSRATDYRYCTAGYYVGWDGFPSYLSTMPVSYNVEMPFLTPSGWIMSRSMAARRFYTWEYRLAGGIESPPITL